MGNVWYHGITWFFWRKEVPCMCLRAMHYIMFSLLCYWKGICISNLQSVQYIWGISYWFLWKAPFGTKCRYANSLGNTTSPPHVPKSLRVVHVSDSRTLFLQCNWCVLWTAEYIHFLQNWGQVFEAAKGFVRRWINVDYLYIERK